MERVLLADDHAVVRQGLRALLERHGFSVVAEAGDGRTAVNLAREHHPDVAVLDVVMPVLNGVDAAHEIARTCDGVGIVLLTMYSEDHYVRDAIRDGVRGFVVKTQPVQDLVQAIHEVSRGGLYVSPVVSRTVLQALRAAGGPVPPALTARERQVLQLVAEGQTTRQIAATIRISVKTADCHRTRIMRKLNIHATAGLVRYAIRQGLVPP
ncbi:MAG TPA: response regulator transcription factor [Gemmatimonadales bacterium]|nr:response regulator transcription factor [Gemmatimonadales bacterium]